MNIEQMLSVLNPEIVERLKTAVEIGKWPNGVALTKEQRETCMQAVIAWELKNLPEEQRSGYIDRGTK
ncbi:TPA: YeaC family protein, partial [Acinetobacter baumannii]